MGFKLKSGNTSAFKMMGSSPAKMHKPGHEGSEAISEKVTRKLLKAKKPSEAISEKVTRKLLKKSTTTDNKSMKPTYKKPVGPRATKKKIKENNNVPLSPGYEDPVKIQKVQREGLTPNSQKFSKIAKKNAKLKRAQDNPKYRGNYDEVD